ncbi:MAG: formylmethanofuran dehydrogenase subunit A, partial [Candidatus Methanomethylicota archaeon]
IKGGEIVVKDGELVKYGYGKTYYVEAKVEDALMQEVLGEVKEKFNEWYTISFENYEIHDHELRHPQPIKVGGV